MIKKFYKFLCKHTLGVIRALYIAPIIAVIPDNNVIFKFVVLICVAISLTIQLGTAGKWDKEDE